jgi:hypothetical protein
MNDHPCRDGDPCGHARGQRPEWDVPEPAPPNRRRRPELAVAFEITTLTGDAGRQLAAQQAAAIRAVLTWLAQNPPTDSPTSEDT